MASIRDYVIAMGGDPAVLQSTDEYFEVVQSFIVGAPGNPVKDNADIINPSNALSAASTIEIRRRIGQLSDSPYGGIVAADSPALYIPDVTPFDGVQAKVAHSLNLGSRFSLEAWVTCTGPGTAGSGVYGTIFGMSPTKRLMFGSASNLRLIRAEMGVSGFNTAVGSVVVGTRVHVVYTYDGAAERIYLNGALASSRSITSGPIWNGAFWEGAYATTSANYSFKGTLERRAFYNKALAAARVLAHFQAG